jgi:hypothetical protein
VNLLPYQGAPPLLNTAIPRFDAEDESLDQSFWRLVGSPDVLNAKASPGITGTNKLQMFVGASEAPPLPGHPKQEPKRFTRHLRNVSLMDALNSLVRANGRGVWRYQEHVCDGEHWDNLDLVRR